MTREPRYSLPQRAAITLSRTVTAAIIVVALYWGRPVFLPIAMAAFLTFVLNPVVYGFQRLGLRPVPSVILSVSIVFAGITLVGGIGSRQISFLLADLPANTSKVTAKVKSLKAFFTGPQTQRFEDMIEEIGREIQDTTEVTLATGEDAADRKGMQDIEPRSETDRLSDSPDSDSEEKTGNSAPPPTVVVPAEPLPWMLLTGYLGSAVEVLATMAFTFVLLMCFLLEREGLRDRMLLLAGTAHLTLTSKALEDATWRVSRYILMVAIVNGGFGLLLGVGLLVMQVPYAILWGCMAAMLRFIPYLGPWMGALFPIAMSVATSEGWSQPISVIGLVIVLELITNNLVEPIVFGRTIGVSPTALLISAAFWLFLWGPIGLILSAPFAVVLVVIGKNIPRLRFLDLLLGDQAALSADVGLYQRLLVQDDHQRLNLIHNQLLNQSAEVSYDELLIPALKYSKRDFLLGLLTEEERDDIVDVIEKAITKEPEASSSAPAAAKDESLKKKKELSADQVTVLGCSAEGETDRLALLMLQGVLDPARWNLEFVAEEILTSELVRHVAEHPPAAVCIAALPPRGLAQARYLCKRLRAVNPGLPLIVGRWGQKRMRPRDRERLREAGATVVTLSLAETVQWLQSHRPIFDQPRPLKNVAPSDVSENPAPIST